MQTAFHCNDGRLGGAPIEVSPNIEAREALIKAAARLPHSKSLFFNIMRDLVSPFWFRKEDKNWEMGAAALGLKMGRDRTVCVKEK